METKPSDEAKKPTKDSEKILLLKAAEAKRLAEQAKKHFRTLKADYKLARKALKQAKKAAKRARKEAKAAIKFRRAKTTKSGKTRQRAIQSVRKSKSLTPAPTVTSTTLPELASAVQTATTAV